MSDFQVAGDLGVNVANFIRDVQTARSELQGMKDDVEELNRQLNELSDKRIKVTVEVDGAAEIAQLRADLDRLSAESVKIKVTIDLDAASVDELRADLAYLSDRGNFAVGVRIDIDGMADLDRLYLQLRELTARRWTIDINIDGLVQTIAALRLLRAELNGVDDGLGGVSEGASGAGGGLGGMMGIILTLLPVLVTLGGVLAGVGAGVVGSMATALVGVGGFAAFAIPTFTKIINAVKGGEDEIAKLPKPMQIAARNALDLKSRFNEMAKSLQPVALGVFAEALNVANAGMKQLFKVAAPAGKAIKSLLADMSEGLAGDEWSKFFNYIAKNTGFFIDTWGHAVGNFITGIANMIVAFDPLSKFVSNGFLGMSQSFLEWTQNLANSKGFQDFVNYVITYGPVVWDLFKKFADAAMQLVIALAPMGGSMLVTITQLVGMAAAFIQANPQITQFLGMAITLAGALMTLWPVISTVASVIGALASGPAVLIVAAIVAIVAIILVWWDKCATFRDFVMEMWGKIKDAFVEAIQYIKDTFNEWLPAIVELWNKYGGAIMDVVEGAWEVIKGVISGAMKVIRGVVNIALGLLNGDWSRVWKGCQQVLSGVWTAIKGIVSGGIKMVEGQIKSWLTAIKNIFGNVGSLLKNAGSAIVNGLWEGISSKWGWVESQFKSKLSSLRNLLPFSPAKKGPFSGHGWTYFSGRSIVEGLAQGMKARSSMLNSTMGSTLSMAQGNMKSTFSLNGNGSYIQPKQSSGAMGMSMGTGQAINFAEGAFKIYNPSAETPSDSANRTMTRVSRFGLFEGAGA